ncbi:MAG: acyl-CoA dehydrogenase family protein [Gammaproteobacteria bacterium]
MKELERLEGFRNDVRGWLRDNVPAGWRERMFHATGEDYCDFQKQWFRTLRAGGYAAPHWPREWGGAGMGLAEQIVFYEEFARSGAPRPTLYFISLYHVPGTLLRFGTQAQKQRYLPGVLERGEVWCQGFSEPNAGSDLASLKTRAERRGDRYIVNGQKIWSSGAQYADYYLLLARTDPAAPKHKGISFLLVDIRTPGIDRRPIRQMTADAEFCEVFLTDVEVPVENLVGGENEGWAVANATLSSERGLTILELTERMRIAFDWLVAEALREQAGGRLADDDEIRRELVRVYTRCEACRALVNEQLGRELRGEGTGTEASIIKLYYSEALRDFTDLGVRITGLESQYFLPMLLGGGYETQNWMMDYMLSYSWTIAGGTNEVMRNIIAERNLGLPRERLG